jgi:nucleotide-binding universal stress UspA family protein
VTGELVPGDPADVLVRRARRDGLLVVGHRQRRANGSRPIGSVAALVAERSPVPVIVHRPLDGLAAGPLPRPVLVGVEGGPGTDRVVGFAFAEAAQRGTALLAVHAWSRPEDAWPAGPDVCAHSVDRARERAERTLTEALERWAEKYPEVRVRLAARHSLDVPVTLTAASRSAQLAVVGMTRHPGVLRPSAGSVAHALLRRAACPVAVVPVP